MKHPMSLAKETVVFGLAALAILCLLYVGVAKTAFKWRNPKANGTAAWQNFGAMMRFERIPDFQQSPK